MTDQSTEARTYLQQDEETADQRKQELLRGGANLAARPEPRALAQAPKLAAAMVAPQGREMRPTNSDETADLYAALARAQRGFKSFAKTKTANIVSSKGTYSYKYNNLGDMMKALGPALVEADIVPMQIPGFDRITVRLVHGASGQWVEGVLPFVAPREGGPAGVQALGSMITYMRRYLLAMMLGVVAVDDDDDGAGGQQDAAPSLSAALDAWSRGEATDDDVALLAASKDPNHRADVFVWRIRVAETAADLAVVVADIEREPVAKLRADMLVRADAARVAMTSAA